MSNRKIPTGAANMRKAMRTLIKRFFPNLGVTLLVYHHGEESIANYISNSNRSDMIKALRNSADRLEQNRDFQTPEEN